jgi:hypothetical protein
MLKTVIAFLQSSRVYFGMPAALRASNHDGGNKAKEPEILPLLTGGRSSRLACETGAALAVLFSRNYLSHENNVYAPSSPLSSFVKYGVS